MIREIMKAAPSQRWSEEALVAVMNTRIPGVRAVDVLDALVWNLSKSYVESTHNDEMECDVWFLTSAGKKA
jgi:anti-sigma-K factor RskA